LRSTSIFEKETNMPDVPVLVVGPVETEGGLVEHGATESKPHAGVGEVAAAVMHKVIKVSSDKLADGVITLAKEIGPSLKARMAGLSEISVQEVSIGCSIDMSGHIVVAGVGAEASVSITFRVT
jgi:hypothetical protein